MSWWHAKYKNNHGEYEITFGSKYYERAKAVEKVCQAVIDKLVKAPEDVAVVVRCKDCVMHGHCSTEAVFKIARIENPFCCVGERRSDDG